MEAHSAMLRRLPAAGEDKNIFSRKIFSSREISRQSVRWRLRDYGQQDDGEVRTPKAICFSAGNDPSILKGITHFALRTMRNLN
jgi:hypothetical protein